MPIHRDRVAEFQRKSRTRIETICSTSRQYQDDYSLVVTIRESMIPPSDQPYNLEKKAWKEIHLLEKAVRNIKNITSRAAYVEVGAGDGESNSPTLHLEMEDGWSGLLIEPIPGNWEKLKAKNRRAYLSPTCVGLHNYSYMGKFLNEEYKSHLLSDGSGDVNANSSTIFLDCFPLYSHLLAFGTTCIDLLIIDINGNEAQVLESLNWSDVNIELIAVRVSSEDDKRTVMNVLQKIGYHEKIYTNQTTSFLLLRKVI